MNINKPKNSNYAGIIVQIKTLVELANCDNLQAAIIFGNQVIVSKDVKVNDIGIYFPVECQLSHDYVSLNNLYRNEQLNSDVNKKGYFDENRRVRSVKLRGNNSEGLFMPISSLEAIPKLQNIVKYLKIDTEFDELNGVEICRKYIITKTPGSGNKKDKRKKEKFVEDKLVGRQFKFHKDTPVLYKNLSRVKGDDIISITYKLHGTSAVAAKVLCKKRLSFFDKIGRFFNFNIVNTQYDYLFSSRTKIKNKELNPKDFHHYTNDIWKDAFERVKNVLTNGLTIYFEIVGYEKSGKYIQKGYDYGVKEKDFEIYVYRVTYTNSEDLVYEFSAKQVQDWCKTNGLNPVPQLYYGYAKDFVDYFKFRTENSNMICSVEEEFDSNNFLNRVKKLYTEKDCYMCSNKVPEEGCVIRIENNYLESFKVKSTRFNERETKLLDSGESNLEEEN